MGRVGRRVGARSEEERGRVAEGCRMAGRGLGMAEVGVGVEGQGASLVEIVAVGLGSSL